MKPSITIKILTVLPVFYLFDVAPPLHSRRQDSLPGVPSLRAVLKDLAHGRHAGGVTRQLHDLLR